MIEFMETEILTPYRKGLFESPGKLLAHFGTGLSLSLSSKMHNPMIQSAEPTTPMISQIHQSFASCEGTAGAAASAAGVAFSASESSMGFVVTIGVFASSAG